MIKSQQKSKYLFSALLLLGMYVMHLTLFEALMFASYQDKENLIEFCLDRNSQTSNDHPCIAADYQRLLKHEKTKGDDLICPKNTFPLLTLFCVPTLPEVKAPIAFQKTFTSHVSDDAFERYRLLNVFLI
jgi:hypothetical protein